MTHKLLHIWPVGGSYKVGFLLTGPHWTLITLFLFGVTGCPDMELANSPRNPSFF